jgi:hypothetical protein
MRSDFTAKLLTLILAQRYSAGAARLELLLDGLRKAGRRNDRAPRGVLAGSNRFQSKYGFVRRLDCYAADWQHRPRNRQADRVA